MNVRFKCSVDWVFCSNTAQCCFVMSQLTKHYLLLCDITHEVWLNCNRVKLSCYASTTK